MAVIKFLIQSKNENAPIYVRFREGRTTDIKVKTNFSVNPKDWNQEKEVPKHTKTVLLKNLDTDLSNLKSKIKESYNSSDREGKNIDSEWLRELISPSKSNTLPNKLVPYFDYYLQLRGNSITPNTIKKISSYKNFLIDFEDEEKKKFQINEIDLVFLNKLLEYRIKKNYSENYISDVVKYVKTICKNAKTNGVKVNPQTESLSVKKSKVPFTYLTEQDLNKIEKFDFKVEYLDNVRDWLIISCETGQRVSDFMRFDKSMIKDAVTPKGKKIRLLEFSQKKTNKKMSIFLTQKVEKILKKRKGQFPRKISEQRYNEWVKIVCKEAEINEIVEGSMKDKESNRQVTGKFEKYKLICSHTGRRSFASNYYMKYPIGYLKNQTGHTSERTFLDYIGKTNLDYSLAFADEILSKK
jgi:hypothetical protein